MLELIPKAGCILTSKYWCWLVAGLPRVMGLPHNLELVIIIIIIL